MRTIAAGLVSCLFASGVLFGQQPQAMSLNGRNVGQRVGWLEERIPEMNLADVPLEAVVDYLGEYLKLNIVVRWEALTPMGIRRDKPISLRLRNLRISQALWLLLNEAGGPDVRLAYRATSNLLLVSTAEDLGREQIVKVYDVADLISPAPNFAGPTIDVTSAGGSAGNGVFSTGHGQAEAEAEGGQKLRPELERMIEVILNTVEPDSWHEGGGKGSIAGFQHYLVVRNTIAVHQLLGGWLTEEE